MKHLKTDFRKFILEKLNSEKKRKYNEDEIEEVQPDDDIEEPIEDGEPLEYDEPEDDEDDDEEVTDDVLSELLNEWKKIKKSHDRYKFHRRKK